ncbi:MAG TPA: PilZ domain-containing protein [Phycisphaerales bacterium]|nr:PilZ domain-containing protein [Phycisphaerales bacterium]
MPLNLHNRRQHERVNVAPMYTHVGVTIPSTGEVLDGHSYDVSEGGVQIELDDAIEPGTQVSMELVLPLVGRIRLADEDRIVRVTGNVAWVDDSEPGPVRLAIAFTRFASEADRARLVEQIAPRQRRAA